MSQFWSEDFAAHILQTSSFRTSEDPVSDVILFVRRTLFDVIPTTTTTTRMRQLRRTTTAMYSAVTESSAPIVNDAAYDECSMDDIVSLCKRRGFIFPSSEIYNGYAGFYDYGPLGAEMKKNIKDAWWKHFVQKREDVVGLDSSIIHNPATWKSSGECRSEERRVGKECW